MFGQGLSRSKLKEDVSMLASRLAPHNACSEKPKFNEEADNYGFAWLPPIETFIAGEGKKYLDYLREDPVFYNPGSYDLMSSCYGVEPYGSKRIEIQPLSWDYSSLREKRIQTLSTNYTVRAVELCRNREYKTALDLLKTALEQWPQNVEAVVAFGACNANLGNLDIAIYQFKHALKLNPESVNARKYLEQTMAKLNSIVLPQSLPGKTGDTVASSGYEGKTSDDQEDAEINSDDDQKKSKKRRRKDDHKKKNKKKSKKKSKEKKRKSKKSSKKSRSSHSSDSSDSSSDSDGGDEDEVDLHPILSRSKHKLWNM